MSSVIGWGFHTKTFLDSVARTATYLCVKSFRKSVAHSLSRFHLGVDYVHQGCIKISVREKVHGVEVKYIIRIETNSVHQWREHSKVLYCLRLFRLCSVMKDGCKKHPLAEPGPALATRKLTCTAGFEIPVWICIYRTSLIEVWALESCYC